MKAKQSKAQYTIEFKQEAIRLVKSGQPAMQVASTLGKLSGAGERIVTPEQMELARLRAENTRLKMERDVLKKAAAYFAKDHL